MKRLIFILGCLFVMSTPVISHAQNNAAIQQGTREYALSSISDNVEFYQAMVDCNGSKTVLLKFNNKNDFPVKVTWKEVFVTAQVQQETDGFREKEIILQPGITSASDCNDLQKKDYVIGADQVSPTYSARIVEFKFKDIQVSRVN